MRTNRMISFQMHKPKNKPEQINVLVAFWSRRGYIFGEDQNPQCGVKTM